MIDSDIVFYGPANTPTDDGSTTGGAIDRTKRPIDSQLASLQSLELLSDDAGDTGRNATVRFRNAAGTVVTELVAVNGTTVVPVPNGPGDRVVDISTATHPTATLTLRVAGGGATVHTVNPTETLGYMLFRFAQATGSAEDFFEVLYADNTHAVDNLLTAAHELLTDPTDLYLVGLAVAKGDVGTLANRKTAPGGVTMVAKNVSQNVPTGALNALERIAIYVQMALGADEAAGLDAPQLRLTGTSS